MTRAKKDGADGESAKKAPAKGDGARQAHRLRKMHDASNVAPPRVPPGKTPAAKNVAQDVGWGDLIFAQTFETTKELVEAMRTERPDRRNIAFYVRDPHVLLAEAPQELFLDPSHTFRLDLSTYRPSSSQPQGFFIRRLTSRADAERINRIYATRGMIPASPEFYWSLADPRVITVFIAEDDDTGEVLGSITGVDHGRAFGDPEKGASMWCLAVDPQCQRQKVGEMLVRRLASYYSARGVAHLDLSVLHDNDKAIALYERIGFRRAPFFTVKRKNSFNEKLFTGPEQDDDLNPYAKIIVNEARRRGIHVDVTDAEGGFFTLSFGGRRVRCRESLSEFTSAVAMSICDDKSVTSRLIADFGIRTPEQVAADDPEALRGFLERHKRVVVKPARGEQGRGVSVGLESEEDVVRAIAAARNVSENVLVEECFEGDDMRLVVIDYKVVAAALRRPASVRGDGETSILDLIKAQSKRRSAATGGESQIPIDAETERTVRNAGYAMSDVLADGATLRVRRTANLHTGGTIHDVTGQTCSTLINAAINTARAIDIPVVGVDLMVKDPREPDYVFIEANERPGLANHEPQPTAERFVDFLFPLSMPAAARALREEQIRAQTDASR